MKEIGTIGLDIAKNVFQMHGVDHGGAVVLSRALRRLQVLAWFAKLSPCLVGRWRRVPPPTTGRSSCSSSGIRCG